MYPHLAAAMVIQVRVQHWVVGYLSSFKKHISDLSFGSRYWFGLLGMEIRVFEAKDFYCVGVEGLLVSGCFI